MDEKLTYIGRVDNDGALKLPGAKMRAEIGRAFTGKEIEITVRRRRKHRSDAQNRYYWGVVIPLIRAGVKDLGDLIDDSEAHEMLKMRFLKKQKIDESTGEIIYEYARSTASLTTVQFLEYIAQCQQFAAEYLGVTIPDPQ